MTPYQVQDDHRPWLRKEEKAFTDLLKRLGCNITRTLHSNDSNISNLFTHFEVLENFKKFHVQKEKEHLQQQQQIAAEDKESLQMVQQQQQQIIQKTPEITKA